jgi:hypothetical protein
MPEDVYIPIDADLRAAIPWMTDDYLQVVQKQVDALQGAPEAQQLIVANWNRVFDVTMAANRAIEIGTRYTLGSARPEALEIFDLGNRSWERPRNQLPPANAQPPALSASRNDKSHT